jgi:integrase
VGKRTGGKQGLSGQFSTIMARAGIAGKITQHTPEGRQNSSLSFHSLRHSFNSAMANAGVSQEIRMKLTGQVSTEMNKGTRIMNLSPCGPQCGLSLQSDKRGSVIANDCTFK